MLVDDEPARRELTLQDLTNFLMIGSARGTASSRNNKP